MRLRAATFAKIKGRTEPDDMYCAQAAAHALANPAGAYLPPAEYPPELLLTQRTTNDWWRDEFVMRALRGDFPDYPVFLKDDGSAIC